MIQDDYYQDMAYRFLQRIKQVKMKKLKDEALLLETYQRLAFYLVNIAEYITEKERFAGVSNYLNKIYKKYRSLTKKVITRCFNEADDVLIDFLITAIKSSEIDDNESWFIDLLRSRTHFKK